MVPRLGSAQHPVWWLNPVWCVLLTVVPVTALAFALDDSSYQRYWRTSRFVGEGAIAATSVALAGLIAGLLGASFVRSRRAYRAGPATLDSLVAAHRRPLRLWYRITLALTLTGYATWLAAAIVRGFSWDEALNVVLRQDYAIFALKDYYFQTIPGLTTLTQFGMAFSTLAALRALGEGWRSVRWPMAAVFAAGLLRSYFLSERLAIIELVVPPAVLVFHQRAPVWQERLRAMRVVIRLAPVLGAGLLVAFFASAEFFRSWIAFASISEWSLLEFSLLRLTGYYVTALNNSLYLMRVCREADLFPGFTLDWLYRFPVLGEVFGLSSQLRELERSGNFSIFRDGANPEFTNTGGLLVPLIDYGWLGGCLFWIAVGLVVGRVWESLRQSRLTGLLLYPMIYVSLLEIVRIPYLFLGRSVPSLAVLTVIALLYASPWRRQAARVRLRRERECDWVEAVR